MGKGCLLILGAGGHGKVAGDCATAASWRELRYFDDRWPTLNVCGSWPVVGTGEDLSNIIGSGDYAFVAIGEASPRLAWLHRLKSSGLAIATVIHPRSIISPHAMIGEGSLVVAGAVINIGSRLGCGCIVNTASSVDHDCLLGDGVHVGPGAHLAGHVEVGDSSWIGIGSTVCQGVRIGAGVMVGAGAVVVSDVADGLTVVGVPARPLERINRLKL